jgi:hypothetical protein
MALDTNIALGIKPVEQPNMLAQMGQMMGIRQAQQSYEEQNALRDAFAQGADIRDPEAFKRIASINPKLAYDLRGRHIEQQQKGVEIGLKTNEALGAALGGLVQNPTLDYARNTFSHLVSLGVLPEDKAAAMYAKLEAEPNRIKEYATLGVQAAISATSKMSDATTQRGQNLSHSASMAGVGATLRGQDLTDKRAREELQYLQGEKGFVGVNKFDPNSARYVGMMQQPELPTAAAAAPANSLLITGAAPTTTPSLNAFRGGSPNQAGPTVANAAAAAAQPTIIKPYRAEVAPTLTDVDDPNVPGQKLRVDARVYKQGTGLGAPGVLGVARTEKLTPQQTLKLKTEMGSDFKILDNVTAQTNDLLKSIDMLRDPEITKGLKAITGYSGVLTPTFKDASQLAQTRLDNLRGKVIALGKASASMTGAIGSIANQEWKILADQIAAIDPKMGDKALLEQVQLVEDRALGVFERAKEQYGRQYGEYFETVGPQYSTMPKLKPRGVSSSGVDRSNPLLQ